MAEINEDMHFLSIVLFVLEQRGLVTLPACVCPRVPCHNLITRE